MKIIFGVDLYRRGLFEWVVGADNVNNVSKGNTRCYAAIIPKLIYNFIYLKVHLSSLSRGITSFINFSCISMA